MMRSNRGAARVSIVWIIATGVLFLVSIVFALVAQSDLTNAREQQALAEARRDTAVQETDEASAYARQLSVAVGWYDEESADPRSKVDEIGESISNLRDTFTDLGAEDDDFQRVIPKIKAAYDAKRREIDDLKGRIQALDNELTVAQNTTRTVSNEKEDQIGALRTQLADETQTATSRNEELERRLAASNGQVSDTDLDKRRLQNDIAVNERTFRDEKIAYETRIRALTETTKFARDPFSRYPDGKILEVSDKLDLAYIDRGSNHRLVRGIRFRVESGTPGVERLKGWIEVTDVEASISEVAIVSVVDAFDPIVAGDVIINPLYDPTGGRNAILVGRFSGAYNQKELRLLLARMGINVQEALDPTTHFMIVGSEIYTDQETGEPLEDPIQAADLPEYRNAEAKGVQIIPIQDIREFFKVENRPSSN